MRETAAAAAPAISATLALAYDWLPDHRPRLNLDLKAAMANSSIDGGRDAYRGYLPAIDLGDHATLEKIITGWWRKQVAPTLKSGQRVISRMRKCTP